MMKATSVRLESWYRPTETAPADCAASAAYNHCGRLSPTMATLSPRWSPMATSPRGGRGPRRGSGRHRYGVPDPELLLPERLRPLPTRERCAGAASGTSSPAAPRRSVVNAQLRPVAEVGGCTAALPHLSGRCRRRSPRRSRGRRCAAKSMTTPMSCSIRRGLMCRAPR